MKNQKGFILPIIIVVVVVALLGTAGYFAYKQYSVPKSIACIEEAKICLDGSTVGRTGPKCELAPCPEVKTDQTADWKTYRNVDIGIEFKYPENWGSPKIYNNGLITVGSGSIITTSAVDVNKGYEDACKQENGQPLLPTDCCKKFNWNKDLLQRAQEQIMKQVSDLKQITSELKQKIEKDFVMCGTGNFKPLYEKVVYNPNINAYGLEIINYFGSDVSPNYHYYVVFTKADKVLSVNFNFGNDFSKLWENEVINKIPAGSSAARTNFENNFVIKPLENKDENSIIYPLVQEYDLFVKSIKLVNKEQSSGCTPLDSVDSSDQTKDIISCFLNNEKSAFKSTVDFAKVLSGTCAISKINDSYVDNKFNLVVNSPCDNCHLQGAQVWFTCTGYPSQVNLGCYFMINQDKSFGKIYCPTGV